MQDVGTGMTAVDAVRGALVAFPDRLRDGLVVTARTRPQP
jgi:hypothetical protein